jgi:hypothetical protein
MSWNDIFSVLDEEMMDAYWAAANDIEKAEFEEWFGVKEINERGSLAHRREINVGETPTLLEKHIVSTTLFWKQVNEGDPELPVPTREKLMVARRMGLVKRFDPWRSYVEPLFTESRAAMEKHPGYRLHADALRLRHQGDLLPRCSIMRRMPRGPPRSMG